MAMKSVLHLIKTHECGLEIIPLKPSIVIGQQGRTRKFPFRLLYMYYMGKTCPHWDGVKEWHHKEGLLHADRFEMVPCTCCANKKADASFNKPSHFKYENYDS